MHPLQKNVVSCSLHGPGATFALLGSSKEYPHAKAIPPPPPGDSDTSRAAALVKRSPTLAVALATLILAAPLALHAQTPPPMQCTLQDARMTQFWPTPGSPLQEGGDVILSVHFPNNCLAHAKPLTVCLDVWDTTACPLGADPSQCDGRIRGNAGILLSQNLGWVKAGGPRICNTRLLEGFEMNGVTQAITSAQLLINTFNDTTKANRQNHILAVMYDPFLQIVHIPIIDND